MLRGKGRYLTAVAALGVAAVAASGPDAAACPLSSFTCPLTLQPYVAGHVSPRALPTRERVPVGLGGRFRIVTTAGLHPPALRRALIRIDRDLAFGVDDLPVCEGPARHDVRRTCRGAIVGWGSAKLVYAFPEVPPMRAKVPLTVFNLGATSSSIRLAVYGSSPFPPPRTLVALVHLEPLPGGEGDWHAVIDMPVIGGGYGSLLEVNLKIRRRYRSSDRHPKSFVSARCPDGVFKLGMYELLFKNESGQPGVPAQTTIKGRSQIACTPKR